MYLGLSEAGKCPRQGRACLETSRLGESEIDVASYDVQCTGRSIELWSRSSHTSRGDCTNAVTESPRSTDVCIQSRAAPSLVSACRHGAHHPILSSVTGILNYLTLSCLFFMARCAYICTNYSSPGWVTRRAAPTRCLTILHITVLHHYWSKHLKFKNSTGIYNL